MRRLGGGRAINGRLRGFFFRGSQAFFMVRDNASLGFLEDNLFFDDDDFTLFPGGVVVRRADRARSRGRGYYPIFRLLRDLRRRGPRERPSSAP